MISFTNRVFKLQTFYQLIQIAVHKSVINIFKIYVISVQKSTIFDCKITQQMKAKHGYNEFRSRIVCLNRI